MGSVAYFDKHSVRIKVCKIAYRNFSARFLWFKQLLWTSNDFYIEFGEIITYHSIGIYSDL